MSLPSVSWQGTLTATSSICHTGETRGTIALLRRETIISAHGERVTIPIISGNTWRGRLRRIGEELLRDTLAYETELTPAAAHALRGGGALAKTGREPLSGSRLQQLRALVPHLGVFGAAGGGTIISGGLDVGKVLPCIQQTTHLTGVESSLDAFTCTQLEDYTRQDDTGSHDLMPVEAGSSQMLFRIETFPAGTTFSSWLRLRRPSELELSFFCSVLDAYRADGRLGGRIGSGHGQVRVDMEPTPALPALVDWRAHCLEHRSDILTALKELS